MTIPTEPNVVELSTDEDWIEDFEFFLASEDEPNDLTDVLDVVAAISMKQKVGEVRLETHPIYSGNSVTINVDRLTLKNLPEGVYNFAIRAVRPGNVDEGLIRGKRKIVHGPT